MRLSETRRQAGFKIFAGFILTLAAMGTAGGCASLNEGCKKVWGSSIVHLERQRPQGKSLEVALPLTETFQKCNLILQKAGGQVYLEDKNKQYLAAMNFQGYVDTTQVGLFFTPVSGRTTKIEVASMSPDLVLDVTQLLSEGFGEQTPS